MEWPTETHINNVAHNGEQDAPVYKYNGLLFRINPVGGYALYFHKGTWRESQRVTNNMVRTNGVMV